MKEKSITLMVPGRQRVGVSANLWIYFDALAGSGRLEVKLAPEYEIETTKPAAECDESGTLVWKDLAGPYGVVLVRARPARPAASPKTLWISATMTDAGGTCTSMSQEARAD